MKKHMQIRNLCALAATILTLGACVPAGDTVVKPEAAEVKSAYDAVNDSVNAVASANVSKTTEDASFSYRDGTLMVSVDVTEGTLYPATVVYTLNGFVAGSYTVSGVQTAVLTSGAWKATGYFTCAAGDIESLETDMQSDYSVLTGTLIVNGRFSYDYATASYN